MKRNVISLIIIILFSCAGHIFAEDSDNIAVLTRGPVYHEGIEFLEVNALPSRYGEYRVGAGTVRIYYTEEPIFFSEDWKRTACTSESYLLLDSGSPEISGIVAAVEDERGWTAFLEFSEPSIICSFIKMYRSRQNYFNNISRDKNSFSFPAILELE